MANEYNQSKFQEEIDAAGIPNVGVNSNGAVFPPEGVTYTPAQLATIETVRTNHNPAALSESQILQQAREALEQGRIYFRNQLTSASPHNPQTMVGNIKPVIDGNAKLLNAITNQVNLLVLALGWTAADVLNPTTNPNRARYLMACQLIFGTVADVS